VVADEVDDEPVELVGVLAANRRLAEAMVLLGGAAVARMRATEA
jgi:hypothetical protein